MKNSSEYEKQKFKIAAVVLSFAPYLLAENSKRCLEIPVEEEKELRSRAVDIVRADLKRKSTIEGSKLDPVQLEKPQIEFRVKAVTNLLYIARLLNIDPDVFSYGFDTSALDGFGGDFTTDQNILGEMLKEFADDNADLGELLVGKTNYASLPTTRLAIRKQDRAYVKTVDALGGMPVLSEEEFNSTCSILKKGFAKAPEDCVNCEYGEETAVRRITGGAKNLLDRLSKYLKPSTKRNPFAACIQCHSKGALYIPFGDLKKLERVLGENKGFKTEIRRRIRDAGEDKMPPNTELSKEQKQAIEAYLNGLPK